LTKTLGLGLAFAGAAAGIVCSVILYFVIVGFGSLLASNSGGGPSLMMRATSFALTFGLLTAGHWSLGIARRRFADDRNAMLTVKVLTVALVAIGLALASTGGRWGEMIASLRGGIAFLLVIAWLVMTHYGSKALEKKVPAGNPAGTR
jgi:hypothetical protein